MLGWAVGFFLAALVAALFGFGGIATAFAGIAQVLFWLFVGLFVLSLLFGSFSARHGGSLASGGRSVAFFAMAAVIGALAYAWIDNDWSAEQAGREIDRGAAQLAQNVDEAGDRAGAFVSETADAVREDAANALDDAGEQVEPEE